MNPDLKIAILRFIDEVKKDIFFFGSCGFVVGILMIWQSRSKELWPSYEVKWASILFNDFTPINALALFLFGYLLLGCFATLLSDLGYQKPYLESATNHVESRIMQITSAIVSFFAGLSALIFIYSLLNLVLGGIKIIIVIVVLSILIIFCLFVILAMRILCCTEPYNKWKIAISFIIVIIGCLCWLLLNGGK